MLDDRPYMRNDYRSDGIQFQWNGRYHWSVTWALLIACVVCFILQSILESQIGKDTVDNYLALSSEGLRHGRIYELITFQFMHDGFWHLFGNLFGLFFFGRAMEEMLGGKGLLKLYLLSGTLGGLLQVALGFLFERFSGGVVGASAGVFGLIAAFAVSRPNQPITLLVFFVLPVTFPAKLILLFEGILAIAGLLDKNSYIAHGAHLGGMLTGIGYIYCLAHSFSLPKIFRHTPRPRVIITPPRSAWKNSSKQHYTEVTSSEFMSREVDPILEKISAQGIQSLTQEEKQILEDARSRMVKR